MKMLARAVAVIAAVGAAGISLAGNPATFDITCSMSGSLSVMIVSGAPVAFGAVAASSLNNNTAAPVVVRNDSAGLVENYRIGVADSAGGWKIYGAAAQDHATLYVKFNSVLPGNLPLDGAGNFDADDNLLGPDAGGAEVLCGDLAVDGSFAGDQDGWHVAPSENNNLWIRFGAPTSDGTGGAAQSFTVTVRAVNP